MATRRDKEKVIDEVWDDDRIRTFLERTPPAGDGAGDHFRLLAAYQGMRAGDFRRFLAMFTAAGGDLDARDGRGRTLADVIAGHRHAGAYLEALTALGAASGPETASTPTATQET